MPSDENQTKKAIFYMKAAAAGYLIDRYKHLKTLRLQLKYLDPGENVLSSRDESRGPYDSAFFEFPCPGSECMEGGYDITNPVAEMLLNYSPDSTGSVACRGWHFNDENYRERCGSKLEYRVTAEYYDLTKKKTSWLRKLLNRNKR